MTTEDELARILPSAARAGVHRLPCPGASVERAARQAGLQAFRTELGDCADKDTLLARLAQALGFPDWFGHNWDALADCLQDMSWTSASGYVLVLEHADHLRRHAEDDFATALEIFDEAAAAWAAEDVPMWVFVGLDEEDARLPAP